MASIKDRLDTAAMKAQALELSQKAAELRVSDSERLADMSRVREGSRD